jgi:hypothetical protein
MFSPLNVYPHNISNLYPNLIALSISLGPNTKDHSLAPLK